MFYKFILGLLKIFFWPIFMPKFIGKENIPNDKGLILISNHTAWTDPVFMGMSTKRRLHFVAKSDFYESKILAYVGKSLEAIPIKRHTADLKALREVKRYVSTEGEICAIFPEGTRNKGDGILPFEKGVAFMALQLKSDVQIVVRRKRQGLRTPIIIDKPINIMALIDGIDRKEQVEFINNYLESRMRKILEGEDAD